MKSAFLTPDITMSEGLSTIPGNRAETPFWYNGGDSRDALFFDNQGWWREGAEMPKHAHSYDPKSTSQAIATCPKCEGTIYKVKRCKECNKLYCAECGHDKKFVSPFAF